MLQLWNHLYCIHNNHIVHNKNCNRIHHSMPLNIYKNKIQEHCNNHTVSNRHIMDNMFFHLENMNYSILALIYMLNMSLFLKWLKKILWTEKKNKKNFLLSMSFPLNMSSPLNMILMRKNLQTYCHCLLKML